MDLIDKASSYLLFALMLLSIVPYMVPAAEAEKPSWAVSSIYFEYEVRGETSEVFACRGIIRYELVTVDANGVTLAESCNRESKGQATIPWNHPNLENFYTPPLELQSRGLHTEKMQLLGREFLVFKEVEVSDSGCFRAEYTTVWEANTGIKLLLIGKKLGDLPRDPRFVFCFTPFIGTISLTATNLKWPTTREPIVEPAGCPNLILTPKLPIAENPLERVRPNEEATYRFTIEWKGELPSNGIPISYSYEYEKANVDLKQLSIEISFSPRQRLQSREASDLMHAKTGPTTPEGRYPITIIATVQDPQIGRCSARVLVILEVNKEAVLHSEIPPLVGKIDLTKGKIEKVMGSKSEAIEENEVHIGDVMQTSADNAIVGIASRDGLIQLWKETKVGFLGLKRQVNPDGIIIDRPPNAQTLCQGLSRCEVFYQALADSGVRPSLLPEMGSQGGLLYLVRGSLRSVSGEYREGEIKIAAILTPVSMLIPLGTEFAVEVADDGSTKVTVLQGQVDIRVPNFVSKKLLGYTLGGNQQAQILGEVLGQKDDQAIANYISFKGIREVDKINQWWSNKTQSVAQPQANITKPSKPAEQVPPQQQIPVEIPIEEQAAMTLMTYLNTQTGTIYFLGTAMLLSGVAGWRLRARYIALLGGILLIAAVSVVIYTSEKYSLYFMRDLMVIPFVYGIFLLLTSGVKRAIVKTRK